MLSFENGHAGMWLQPQTHRRIRLLMESDMTVAIRTTTQPKTYLAVLVVLGFSHLLNDLMQSLIPAAMRSARAMTRADCRRRPMTGKTRASSSCLRQKASSRRDIA